MWCLCLANFIYFVFAYNRNQSILIVDDDAFSWNPEPVAAVAPPNGGDGDRHRKHSLTDAVNAMRCLTTPGCYPSINCATPGERPRQVPIAHAWEQQAFCAGDLRAFPATAKAAAAPAASNSSDDGMPDDQDEDVDEDEDRCLVYSFGLFQSSEWEQKMASIFGCDVYAFDPTSSFPEKIAPRVTFHKLGLQGEGTDNVAATHSTTYDAIDPSRLRTLGEIVALLGHEHRHIDVLRLDCEGCEYGVLKELACNGDSHLVKQLMVEFHFQKNLGLADDDDVLLAGEAIKCLEEERWGVVSIEKSGVGPDDQEYTDSALKFIKHSLFLMYVTFRRVPVSEKLGWELYGDYVRAEREVIQFGGKHEYWREDWMDRLSEEGKGEQKRIWENERVSRTRHVSLVRDRPAVFDEGFAAVPDKN